MRFAGPRSPLGEGRCELGGDGEEKDVLLSLQASPSENPLWYRVWLQRFIRPRGRAAARAAVPSAGPDAASRRHQHVFRDSKDWPEWPAVPLDQKGRRL